MHADNTLTRKLGPAGRAAADPGRCGGGAGDGCWFVRRSGPGCRGWRQLL